MQWSTKAVLKPASPDNQIKSNLFIGLKIQLQDCHQAQLTFTL